MNYLSGFCISVYNSHVKSFSSKPLTKDQLSVFKNLPDGHYFVFQLSSALARAAARTKTAFFGALVNCQKSRLHAQNKYQPQSEKELKAIQKHSSLSNAYVAFKLKNALVTSIMYLGALFNVEDVYFVSGVKQFKLEVRSMKDLKKQQELLNRLSESKRQQKLNGKQLVKEFLGYAKEFGFKYTPQYARDAKLLKNALEIWCDENVEKYRRLLKSFFMMNSNVPKNPLGFAGFVKNAFALNNPEKVIEFCNAVGIKHQAWFLEIDYLYSNRSDADLIKRTLAKRVKENPDLIKKVKTYLYYPNLVEKDLCKFGTRKKSVAFGLPINQQPCMMHCGCGYCYKAAAEASSQTAVDFSKPKELLKAFKSTYEDYIREANAEVKRKLKVMLASFYVDLLQYFSEAELYKAIPKVDFTNEELQEARKILERG